MNKNGLTSVLVLIILILLSPALCYFFGWIAGHILKFFIGDIVINGMNYLFNTTRFTADMLPTMCGVFSVIGSFLQHGMNTHTDK